MAFLTEYSAAVTAARLRDGQPVSTAALSHLAHFERCVRAEIERSKLQNR